MNIKSKILDKRICATNLFIELTYKEYLEIAEKILKNNELQRKRVKSSNSVYSLLKNDLKKGCIIPPIVLAMVDNNGTELDSMTDEMIEERFRENIEHILILDGLQRTYTLFDIKKEFEAANDVASLETFNNYILRCEVYIGINKFGILYRMLTLNTGQTPMSIRHQLEIMYRDLKEVEIPGVELLAEVDNKSVDSIGKYKFQDVIGGFNSYLERDELPLDRTDLLNNIKGLEKLAEEQNDKDLFIEFIRVYDLLVKHMNKLSVDGWVYNPDESALDISTQPFGTEIFKIFSKAQAISGFGAAIGRLKDFGIINNFSDIEKQIENIKTGDSEEWIYEMLRALEDLKSKSKKIGNSQRVFFNCFFRELFNPEGDSFVNLKEAVANGHHKYRSMME